MLANKQTFAILEAVLEIASIDMIFFWVDQATESFAFSI